MTLFKKILFCLLPLCLVGCLGYPKNVKPVSNFELQPYLGKWYEIARLDHSFERGMDNVSATYSMRDDGGVKVLNQGYSKDGSEEAIGKAYFVENSNVGYLKVSFFGPFYGAYVVFDVDPTQYSFISGNDTDMLWFLSRTPTVSEELKTRFTTQAESLGFDTSQLIWVNQDKNTQP